MTVKLGPVSNVMINERASRQTSPAIILLVYADVYRQDALVEKDEQTTPCRVSCRAFGGGCFALCLLDALRQLSDEVFFEKARVVF